jgi:hypothetical protein
MRSLRALLVVALAGAGVFAVAGVEAPATAAALVSYHAVAAADGMRQVVTRPDAPLSSQVVDAGVPSAQASIDNLGNSQAYGSFLYPGETVLSGPGLLSGVVGQSLPNYPVIAASSDPTTPEQDSSQGPLQMKAQSGPTSSEATSSFASPQSGVGRLVATAKVTGNPTAGTLSAVSTGEATPVDVAGVLSLSSVRSHAEAALDGGRITSKTSLTVGDMTVAGVRVVLTPQGLTLPGQNVPLPDNSPITGPLRQAGVTVELVPSERLSGGVRSGGVRITTKQDTPEGGSVTVSYTFGQSLALVAATVDQSDGGPLVVIPSTPVVEPSTGTAVPPDTSSPPPTQPDVGSGGPVPTTAPAPSSGGPAPVLPTTASSVIPYARMDTLSFYLVLVLAAAVALTSQRVLRRFGVSSTWTS